MRAAPTIANRPIRQRYFGIPFSFTIGTTAGATYPVSYTISTGFNFILEMLQYSKLDTNGVPDSLTTPAIRDVQLQLRDEFTSEDFLVAPVYLSQLAGDGRHPSVLVRPYAFLGGSTITVTITDVFGGASGFNLQVALLGFKVKKL